MATKTWTTKDGTVMLIKNMSDRHLLNTIRLIQRKARTDCDRMVSDGYSTLGFVNGEMAEMDLEQAIWALEEHGLDPSEICPEYADLIDEARSRGMAVEENG